MIRFTLEERWEILEIYFQNKDNFAEIVRKCRTKFGRNNAPTEAGIRKFIKKVRETGFIVDAPTRVRTPTPENIEAVAVSVRESPGTSTRHRAQELTIKRTTLRRILHKDLSMTPYKVQLVQELKPRDHPMRFRFAKWANNQLAADVEFHRKIIFSDEAHFHLSGYVNKQNCRIWGTENPHAVAEKPMYPQKVTVWCGFWSRGIVGPFFFENADEKAVTVNGERYRAMINDYLFPALAQENLDNIWFQQDGAPCHTAHSTIDLLATVFGNRIISRNSPIEWPPRSCDLTPLDYYLWGAVKDKCYANAPATIQDLKANIRTTMAEILPQTIENVLTNWTNRTAYCEASRGSHLNEIIFHF